MDRHPKETRIVYTSFDRFPSPKGAATHIDAFVSALGKHFGGVDLLTIPSEEFETAERRATDNRPGSTQNAACSGERSPVQPWAKEGVAHHQIRAYGGNLFERVLSFRSQVWSWWRSRFIDAGLIVPIVHFRSIFEGYPIARHKDRFCRKLVFEVNGLPSIELKYRYPGVADDAELHRKMMRQEQVCLDAADLILTVSQVNAEHLIRRGVSGDRIRIIPNGVDPEQFAYGRPRVSNGREWDANRSMKMLYSGTMSAWQGVSIAIEALALARRDFPASLTLVGHARPHQVRDLRNLAYECGVADNVRLLEPVSKQTLAKLHHDADVIVAPLTRNDRNLVQGCCPLKVLEAMASGTPLIASDIPVVRELVTNHTEALLVRPGSAKAVKDGMLWLRSTPGLSDRLSRSARARVERDFTWSRAQRTLVEAYEDFAGISDGAEDK